MEKKVFIFQFIDGERKAINGDHYDISGSVKIYKDVLISPVIETPVKPTELVAIVSLAQLKWLEIRDNDK